MTLSKFITANNLEAIAAPEIKVRARIRRNEAVFCTVDGAKSDGSGYASVMFTKTKGRGFLQPKPSSSQFSGCFSQRHSLLKEGRRLARACCGLASGC